MVVIGVIVPSSEISFTAKAEGFKRTTLGNYFAFSLVIYFTEKVRLTINRQGHVLVNAILHPADLLIF